MANEIVASVTKRITEMQENEGLKLPAQYSASNALNAAWLILSDNSKGQSLLDKTSPQSQAKALLNMVIQGLSPAKNQVYFVPYGQTLTLTRSYFGSLAILRRLDNVKDVWAEIVHEGDEFQIGQERGRVVVKTFEPRIENQDKPIAVAYACIIDANGTENYTIMTKKQIDQSWSHAKTKIVQREFPEEMAKRTVLNRAAKFFINSSSDNDLMLGAVNEANADEYENERKDVTETQSIADLTAPAEPAPVDPAPEEPKTEPAAPQEPEVTPDASSTDEDAPTITDAEFNELLHQQS